MHRFPGDRPRNDRGPGDQAHPDAAGRSRRRALLVRIAFVGSAACGIVLSAGAAAHADSTGAGLVSTAVQTVSTGATTTQAAIETTTTTVDKTVNDVTTTVDKTVDDVTTTVDKTVDDVATSVDKTVDDVTTTVDKAVDDVTTTVDRTVRDVSTTVDVTVRDVSTAVGTTVDRTVNAASTTPDTGPASRVSGVLALASGGGDPAGDARRVIGVLAAARSRMLVAPQPFVAAISTDTPPARARRTDPPVLPAIPARGSAPPWPIEPAATGLVLALVGFILLRSVSLPPPGWRRNVLSTAPFHGAAVALAVERPG